MIINRDRNCTEVTRLMSRHIDGALAPADRARLEAHLSGCQSCRNEAEALSRADRAAARALADLRPDTGRLAREVIARAEAGAATPIVPLRGRAGSLVPLAAAAAAVALVVVGLALNSGGEDGDSGVAVPASPAHPVDALESRFISGGVSCEIDPRGIDVDWGRIAGSDIRSWVVERYDGHGRRAVFETGSPQLLDERIEPGEEYFYVVRPRPEREPTAFLGLGAVTVDVQDEDVIVRYEGGTRNVAYLQVTFVEAGETYAARLILRPGERVGGRVRVPGRGIAELRTRYVLMGIDWDVERTTVDEATGAPRTQLSKRVRLADARGQVHTLWIREDATRGAATDR